MVCDHSIMPPSAMNSCGFIEQDYSAHSNIPLGILSTGNLLTSGEVITHVSEGREHVETYGFDKSGKIKRNFYLVFKDSNPNNSQSVNLELFSSLGIPRSDRESFKVLENMLNSFGVLKSLRVA